MYVFCQDKEFQQTIKLKILLNKFVNDFKVSQEKKSEIYGNFAHAQ